MSHTSRPLVTLTSTADKDVFVGTPQTSASSALTSTSYAALPTNGVSITFSPTRTAKFRIECVAPLAGNTVGESVYARIQATVGSPTIVFSQETVVSQPVNNYYVIVHPVVIATLTANTSYTFELQAKTPSGTVTGSFNVPTNGVAIIATEIG